MALSGSFSGSILSGHYKLRVDWSATQNITANTSKVTAVMYLVHDWKLIISARSDNSTSIAGTAQAWSSPSINGTGTTKLGTVTSGNITHNADGTKSVAISATFNVRATIDGTYYEKITASATVTLDTIPRATTPTLSPTSVDMGASVTIGTPRASSAFTHDLEYSFAGGDYVKIATGVATSTAWQVPDFAASLPSAASGTVTIRCITKNGGTPIGTKTALLTVKVPASVVPSIDSVTITEATEGLAEQFGAFIQDKSTLRVVTSASGAKGSTITSVSSVFGPKTYSGTDWTSDVVTGSGYLVLTVTVTDSRGRKATWSNKLAQVLPYAPPRIYAFSAYRVNETGQPDDDGDRVALRYNYEVDRLNDGNTANMVVEYKRSTSQTWSTLLTGSALSADTTQTPTTTLSTDYQYDLRLTVEDFFGASTPYRATLPSGAVILDIKADGEGIAFGKTADKAGVDFGWSAKGAVLGLRGLPPVQEELDLNDLLTPGAYSFDNSSDDHANCPVETSGTVRVWSSLGEEDAETMIQEIVPGLNDLPTYRRAIHTNAAGGRVFEPWKAVTLNGQTVLWSGTSLMEAGASITLPSTVSAQSTGIVLVFSRYNNGAAVNSNYHTFFVPKYEIAAGYGGYGFNFLMASADFGVMCNKLLFIADGKISGYTANNATGTGGSQIKYNNAGFALRYVLGV